MLNREKGLLSFWLEVDWWGLGKAGGSLAANLLFALYNLGLGIYTHTMWFVAMSGYYIILSSLRFAAVRLCIAQSKTEQAIPAYCFIGLSGTLLAVLSLILSAVVYFSLSERIALKYDTIIMISIATYTFYKLTMAIICAVRQRRNNLPFAMLIRNIGYADVAGSVLNLQRSMLASFGGLNAPWARQMNIQTGAAVCLFVFILGSLMLIKSVNLRKADNIDGKIENY